MNMDAVLLGLLAVLDMALLVHLRERHGRRVRMERMMASLRMAVQRENDLEPRPEPQCQLAQAG